MHSIFTESCSIHIEVKVNFLIKCLKLAFFEITNQNVRVHWYMISEGVGVQTMNV